MKDTLKPGLRFEWQTTVPERAVVPALYGEHIDFAQQMPAVLATGYMVGLMELACTQAIIPHMLAEKFHARLAEKKQRAGV